MALSTLTRLTHSLPPSTPLTIALLPGDGIGPQVINSAQSILQSLPPSLFPNNLSPKFIGPLPAGWDCFKKVGKALPDETLEALRETVRGIGGSGRRKVNAALFGAVSSPTVKTPGYSSPIVQLRKELDLFANVRPVKSTSSSKKSIDMTIVRENTECLYVKREKLIESDPNNAGMKIAFAERQISEKASRRIGEMAMEIALRSAATRRKMAQAGGASAGGEGSDKKPKVTIVHKSNVLSVTDGLFRESIRDVFEHGGNGVFKNEIELEEQIVDSLVYKLFRNPEQMETLVCPNLYGDIVSDAAAALVGSLGLVPSVNAGSTFIMGEPVHGSAPDIANLSTPIANPIAAIRSAGMMLEFLGLEDAAAFIEKSVGVVMEKGEEELAEFDGGKKTEWLTPDLGGVGTTEGVTEKVRKEIEKLGKK